MKTSKSNYSIDTFIKIVILSALIIWSFYITKPFILLIIWSIIVAVALFPLYNKVIALFKGKKKGLITSLFVIILLALIVLPTISMTQSLVAKSTEIYQNFENHTLEIPPPNSKVKDWPLIGKDFYSLWSSASSDIESFISSHPEEVKNSAGWIFDSFKGLMSSVLLSIVALIIAGVFMASASGGHQTGVKFMNKLVNGKGIELMEMCTNTIRSVV